MSTTYAQRQNTAQKKDASSAASVHDNSSQSESLQRKADMANNAAQRAEAPRPNNTGMPDNLKAGIESLSGFSMDDVRVHYNSSKPATVQALAYTQGTDIHVAPGQEKHLPHEAWHVAQQMAGRVSPTTNINGMPVNDNAALEHEADVMGENAKNQEITSQRLIQYDSTPQIYNSVVKQCIYNPVPDPTTDIEEDVLEWGLYQAKIYNPKDPDFKKTLLNDYSAQNMDDATDDLWIPSLNDLEQANIAVRMPYQKKINDDVTEGLWIPGLDDLMNAKIVEKLPSESLKLKIYGSTQIKHNEVLGKQIESRLLTNLSRSFNKKNIVEIAAKIAAGVTLQGFCDGNHRSHALLAATFLTKNGAYLKRTKNITMFFLKLMPETGGQQEYDELYQEIRDELSKKISLKSPREKNTKKSWKIIIDESKRLHEANTTRQSDPYKKIRTEILTIINKIKNKEIHQDKDFFDKESVFYPYIVMNKQKIFFPEKNIPTLGNIDCIAYMFYYPSRRKRMHYFQPRIAQVVINRIKKRDGLE